MIFFLSLVLKNKIENSPNFKKGSHLLTISFPSFFTQLSLSVVVTPVRRLLSLNHMMKVPSLTHLVTLWLPVLKDTH